MEGISDIRISGIDQTRPPMILKEPYINLFFKLNHQAPALWCEDFNTLVLKGKYPAKIEASSGLIIQTWVRKPEEIQIALDVLKKAVLTTSVEYIARIESEAKAASERGDEQSLAASPQGQLNRIVSELNFDH